ncbi:ser/Thr protein phosphatase family protein [Xylaria grammica]|nr:ser/Thr protein phosphatase family protein [Xylaria grammica]
MACWSDASDTPDTADSAKPDAVRTRLLIISDTHGAPVTIGPDLDADVAIHCGDLTRESKLAEFQIAIDLLRSIHAPLKLVIAGNHDFTLDTPVFQKKVDDARRLQGIGRQLIAYDYGECGEARRLLDEAKDAGIVFLDEGNYDFFLGNSALLKVYASPFTPSLGDWAFQYTPQQGHQFAIAEGTHIAVTHGPPLGICDYTQAGWGARLVSWRDPLGQNPSHFTDIDNHRSTMIETLSTFRAKSREWTEREGGCVKTKHGSRDILPICPGRQTLFVNAAVEDLCGQSPHLPWLVELELPRYTGKDSTVYPPVPENAVGGGDTTT